MPLFVRIWSRGLDKDSKPPWGSRGPDAGEAADADAIGIQGGPRLGTVWDGMDARRERAGALPSLRRSLGGVCAVCAVSATPLQAFLIQTAVSWNTAPPLGQPGSAEVTALMP